MVDQQRKSEEVFPPFTAKAAETAALFAEAQQRLFKEIVGLSAETAMEGVRLYADLQQTAIEVLRDAQASTLRCQSAWHESPKDPVRWSQAALAEGVDGAHKSLRIAEANVQALARSAERVHASTERAGKSIQDALAGVVSKMKEIYAQG